MPCCRTAMPMQWWVPGFSFFPLTPFIPWHGGATARLPQRRPPHVAVVPHRSASAVVGPPCSFFPLTPSSPVPQGSKGCTCVGIV